MDWSELFQRAASTGVSEHEVRDALATRRGDDRQEEPPVEQDDTTETDESSPSGRPSGSSETSRPSDLPEPNDQPDPSPARVVADADVLAADLLVGGTAREALDELRRHSWTTLVASDTLLNDAEEVIAELTDASLADAWRSRVEDWREPAVHPAGDHPALGSAFRGAAMHVLSFDDGLTSAAAGTALQSRLQVSVREPAAFAAVFDAERLYPEAMGTASSDAGNVDADREYPGPDRDPRG